MKRKFLSVLLLTALAMTIAGCSNDVSTEKHSNNEEIVSNDESSSNIDENLNVKTKITLNNSGINVEGADAEVDNNIVTIKAGGTYSVTGSLDDGQIIVDSQDEENVYIVLNGINIYCSNSAPIYVKNAKNAILVLSDGSENYIQDSSEYVYEQLNEEGIITDEPNACIFSKDDLTIKGNGTLIVEGNYNNGIASKDDLKITGGNIQVTAVNNGLKGKDSITIKGGDIVVSSEGDGIKSDNTTDTEKGNIVIEGGTLNITSGDDGIHADNILEINGGDITIVNSYEGLEATDITINDGNINLKASDDGINAAGGNDSSNGQGFFGGDPFSSSTGTININGGYIVVDADGDGIDSNGSIVMTDGTVIVNGPEDNGNGALDYDTTFDINGGILIAAGSYGMSQSTSTSSTQPSINVVLPSTTSESLISIKNSAGEEILTFMPSKKYQSVIISTSELVMGESYNVYYGGNYTGTSKDGIYSDGTYLEGKELTSFTLSSTVMTVSSTGATEGSSNDNRMPGGMNPGGGRPKR